MWLTIILVVLFVLLLVYAIIHMPKSEYDQQLEDEDQIKWLQQNVKKSKD